MPHERGSMEVIVKLVPAAAVPDNPAYRAVQACAARIGISLEPLHPFISDPDLTTYFIAHVDPARLNGIVEQLLGCDGVEGAYAKPRGEAPERRIENAR